MITTLYGVIIKLFCIFIFSYMHLGIYALILSEVVNIFYVVITNYIKVNNILKK